MTLLPVLRFTSGSAAVTCGALPTGGLSQLTAEGWWRVAAISRANRPLLWQYGPGGQAWALMVTSDGRLYFVVWSSGGTNVAQSAAGALARGRWAHVAGTYNGSQVRVWLDGRDVTTAERIKGGAVATTNQAVRIGGYIGDAATGFEGAASWQRVSNNVRYPGLLRGADQPPVVDSHTLAQWNLGEGTGASVDNAQGTASYDGVIAGASWSTSEAGDKLHSRPVGFGWWGRRVTQGPQLGVGNHG